MVAVHVVATPYARPPVRALQGAGLVAAGFFLGLIINCIDLRGQNNRENGRQPMLNPHRAEAAQRLLSTPSYEVYQRSQDDPSLIDSEPDLWREFEAAPWLLPARTKALPYAGLHDFDELLEVQAGPVGEDGQKGVALLLFRSNFAVMTQNSIYSMVKHGGASNFIALTWTPEDLEACADLNLPCADVSHMLVEPINRPDKLTQHDFLVMVWLKAPVVLHTLSKGYITLLADTDTAYSVKDLWGSYLAFIEEGEADGAFQFEAPMNTGHFVLLPTPASLAFAAAWNASAAPFIAKKVSEQKSLPPLEGKHFVMADSICRCYRFKYELKKEGRRDEVAIFRTYSPSHTMYTHHICTIGSEHWMPRIDPCDWAVLYLHPICALGAEVKEGSLRAAGFWFMDSADGGCQPQEGSSSRIPVCRPLQWRLPETEAAHYSCKVTELGLVHGGPPPGLAAIRAGPSEKELEQLLEFVAANKC